MCGIACWILLSPISQVRARTNSASYLLRLTCVFCFAFSSSYFPFRFILAPGTGGCLGVGTPRYAGRSMNTCAAAPFLVSHFSRDYEVYLGLQRRPPTQTNGNSPFTGDTWLRRNHDIAVGARKKRWPHCGSRGSLVCRYVSPGAYTPFLRF